MGAEGAYSARMQLFWRGTRLVVETILGYLLLVAGGVMLLTPGPGIVTIIAGLAVLSRHYHWADRLKRFTLSRIRDSATALRARRTARRSEHQRHGRSGSDARLRAQTPDRGRSAA
jgi:uncharacterized protein (TIGR02611 family)